MPNIASLVFRWLAIPYLQQELDNYVHLHNNTARRANRRKILPCGIPDLMFKNPSPSGAVDFKVRIDIISL